MTSHKFNRINENIKREITAIIREMRDPRLKYELVSIVRVILTPDLTYCRVYVSSLEGQENAETAVEGLKSAAGWIRRELSGRLELRHTPQIQFFATDAMEHGFRINDILNKIEGNKHDEIADTGKNSGDITKQ